MSRWTKRKRSRTWKGLRAWRCKARNHGACNPAPRLGFMNAPTTFRRSAMLLEETVHSVKDLVQNINVGEIDQSDMAAS